MKPTVFKCSRLALAAGITWASVQMAAAQNVIPLESYWQMWIGTQNPSSPSTVWRAPQFGDSTWQRTLVPAGYPSPTDQTGIEAQLQTVLPPSSTPGVSYTTLFFRQSFVLTNVAAVHALKLTLYVDDGAIAWLNGVEVARYNVAAGELPYTSTADAGIEVSPQEFSITAGAPVAEGTNVLAVEVFNVATSSSDMVFAATVDMLTNEPPLVIAAAPQFNQEVDSLGLIEVYFSEAVTNVNAADLLMNGVPATNMVSYAPNDYLFYFAEPAPGIVQVSFAANHGITDRATPPLAFAGTNWTYTLDTNTPGNVMISEFLAANNANIEDEDGDNSDWIELYNPGPTTVNLAGWHLTDDRSLPAKWTFPSQINMNLGPNQYLLVWASGKDRTNDVTRLHTNFRLDRAGEYLGLFTPGLEVASEFAPAYPLQFTDASYGRDRTDPNLVGYYTVPTPGRQNATSGPGFSTAPSLSVASGVFTVDSISVSMTANSNAVIRYTLDGSEPTNGSPVYSSALTFNSNIVVKARAFEPGLWPSPIVARTYHFLDPSARNFSSELPIVIVSTAGRIITENIIGGGNRTRGSLVVIDTFRGRSSIQQTPQFIGLAQFEGIGQTAAGFPKRPYRIEVNDELGNDMDVSLLGLPPEADFQLEVKMQDKTMLNGFLAHELHSQMGHYAPRRKFVEVFLDTRGGKILYPDDYIGIYELTEKIERDKFRVDIAELTPQDTTEPEISGGYIFKKDKDSTGDLNFTVPGGAGHSSQALKIHEPKPRFITQPQFNYLVNYLTAFSQSLYASDWLERTGTNHYSNYIDVDSFVDQHWIVEYTKNIDGYRLSRFWSKDRGGKIKDFPIWDFDSCFGNANYLECGRTNGWYWNEQQEGMTSAEHVWERRLLYGTNNIQGGPGGAAARPEAVMHSGDPVYIQKIIDRWGELRTNIFATPRILGRVDELVALLNEAAARNYQKWPILMQYQWPEPSGPPAWDVKFDNQPTYAAIISEMKKWITGRFNWVDAQFVRAPLLNQEGGYISGPFQVTIGGPQGAPIYYTTDGTDPRAANGTVAPVAQLYSGAFTIADNARVFARARIGTNQYSWSPPAAATFVRNTPGLRITEIMYHPAQDGLEYLGFENTDREPLNVAGFQLSVGVDFTFPDVVLQSGQRAFVVENAAAFTAQYGSDKLVLGEYSGKLDNAGERLVLTGPLREPILDFAYDDAWYPITDGLGFSLVINEDSAATTTWGDSASWHPNADPSIPHVVINEVIRAVRTGEVGGVELRNLASEPADISGWYLTDDLGHLSRQIPPDTVIPAGGYRILSQYDFGADFVGDELFLLSAKPDGPLTGYMSMARIGFQSPQISSGRYINSAGQEHFVPQQQTTLGFANAGPAIPGVVISEIMYHPPDVLANGAYWDNTEDEFVELHNRNGAGINLTGYALRGAGINYQFGSTVIQPAAYLLVVSFDPANAQQLTAFRAKYGVSPSVQIVGPYAGSLANGGAGLELSVPVHYDTEDFQALLERVDYERNAPWTSLPDGGGLSLNRVASGDYANDPANWRASTPSPGRAAATGVGPVITTQPQSRTVVASSTATATFVVGVAGTSVRYQWRKNTMTIAGATNASLSVPATSTADAGNYDVIVSDVSGFTVSSNAALTVLIGITIVQQPQYLSVRVPANARFTVLASSPSPIAYQWRFNGNAVPQANGPELFLPNAGEDNEGLYDVVMTDSVGTVISAPARLTILAPPVMVAPVPPLNLVAVVGDRLTVSARLSGTLPIGARWRWTRGDGTSFTIADQIINERVGVFSLVVPNDTVGRVRLSVTNAIGGSLGFAATNAIVTVLADSDGDHIPDIYEQAHGMNPNNPADAAADPDGDGMSNRDEYIAGTDPQDRNSYLKVELQGANLATIHFQAVSNRSYTVQYADSLNPPAWHHLEHVVARQTNFTAVVIDPTSVPKRFYRLATPATP